MSSAYAYGSSVTKALFFVLEHERILGGYVATKMPSQLTYTRAKGRWWDFKGLPEGLQKRATKLSIRRENSTDNMLFMMQKVNVYKYISQVK